MKMLTQAEVENRIMELDARLEQETEAFAKLSDEKAEAEADWKFAYYRALINVVAQEAASKVRTNADRREAVASIQAGQELFLRYRLADERQRAASTSIATVRQRLDNLRTLSANIRAAT